MSFSADERALALFQRGLDADDDLDPDPTPPGEERDPEDETREQRRQRWARSSRKRGCGNPFTSRG